MAGSPPKPPPPTFSAAAGGSSSPKPPPPPPRFASHPSYEELIDSHLGSRVVSGTKADFIHETDLYSNDPYQLTEDRPPTTASNGERAWYFFTPLRPKGSSAKKRMKRDVDTGGREGRWVRTGSVHDVISNGQRLGRRRGFTFDEKVGGTGNRVKSAWRMMELRLDPDQGGQEEGSPDLLVVSKVYRFPYAVAEDEMSSTAVVKADADAEAREGADADEKIGAETAAAGPGRKRKAAGDKDSGGAETVASSPGRQKKADGGESADAATTGEIFVDSKDPLDAAEKAEQEEPRVPGRAVLVV